MSSFARKRSGSTLVYSTETGRMCPDCNEAIDQCRCRQEQLPQGDGVVRVSLETKGRRGKGVTVIKGIPLVASELLVLAKQLRTACGSGGTCKEGVIEIQGDHRELVIKKLSEKGWVVKRAGG